MNKVGEFVYPGTGDGAAGVGGAVENGDAAGVGILNAGTGKGWSCPEFVDTFYS